MSEQPSSGQPSSGQPVATGSAGHALAAGLVLVEGPLRATMSAIWQPAGLTDRYLRYLAVMHGVLRASVPLMQLAVRRCAERPGDPVAAAWARYLEPHIAEEQDHDAWLLADLAAAGCDPGAVLAAAPTAAVARLVGAQYYWIEHHHPLTLAGYVAVLEGHPPPPWLAGVLIRRTGLPEAAFRTLHHHAVVDGGHGDELATCLTRIRVPPALAAAVGTSALATVEALIDVLALILRPERPLPAPGDGGPRARPPG